ncbi:hypothetical protein BTA51_20180 [Hahella sp. CCB-MM4]|uniref:UTRA domain-containing protein n=1 Tax=Hahella sp. (strain CCB-MM4) TaxID=1926491 RepID=UPI000B9AFB04|nr:UTRA domain-containing protein [Hahella sp. CCB-MM4]OZG71599.1 hypothetical protein BTA51_20180 [Hahella sp. CCB-MM4]
MNQTTAYQSLAARLQHRIGNGELAAGSKLPSERSLCDMFKVSRVSARDALHLLEAQGMIYRLNRLGWFVSPPVFIYDPTRSSSIQEEAHRQCRELSTELLSASLQVAPTRVARGLEISPTQPVYVVTRRRAVDKRWVLLEICYFKEEYFPGLLEQPLAASLTVMVRETYGFSIREMDINISSAPLDIEHAQHLQVREGCPSLRLERKVTSNNQTIAFEREYWLHDAIQMRVKGRD